MFIAERAPQKRQTFKKLYITVAPAGSSGTLSVILLTIFITTEIPRLGVTFLTCEVARQARWVSEFWMITISNMSQEQLYYLICWMLSIINFMVGESSHILPLVN
jgi:hypothetical protein